MYIYIYIYKGEREREEKRKGIDRTGKRKDELVKWRIEGGSHR